MAALALGQEDADALESDVDLLKTCGYLLKKGSGEGALFSRRNWTKRYYALDEDNALLHYYTDDTRRTLKGTWKLTESTKVASPDGKAFRGSGRRDSLKGEDMHYFEVHPLVDAKTDYFKHRPLELRAADARDLRGWTLGIERAVGKYARRGRARTVAASPADDLERFHAQLADAVTLCEDVEAAMVAPPVTRPSRDWMLRTLEAVDAARRVVDGAALAEGSGAFRDLILAASTSNATIKQRLADLRRADASLRARVAAARDRLGAALGPPPGAPPPPPPPPPLP